MKRPTPEPFDRLPTEGNGAFKTFQVFLELGRDRSLPEVSRRAAVSIPYCKKLSRRFNWFARASEYDASFDRIARAAEEAKLQQSAGIWAIRMQKTREEAYQFAQALKAKAKEMLAFPLKERTERKGKVIVKPMKWTMADVSRMADVAQKLENLAVGAPTEHHEVTGPNNGPVAISAPSVVFYIPENGRDKPIP